MSEEINALLFIALPTNVLVEVTSYLNLTEICRMGGTCKRLYEISGNLNLWANYLPGVPLEEKKAVFVRRCKISQNVNRRVTIPFILQGHNDMILNLDVQGSSIVSASRDGTVKKWDVAKKKGVTYEGHSDWVVAAKFYSGGVISASADRSVRLWRDDGEECKMAKGHSAGITCLKIVNPTVAATGSYDSTVKLWDLKAGKLISTFTDHGSAVNCVDVLEGIMVSGTVLDGKIVLRDLQAGGVVRSFLV